MQPEIIPTTESTNNQPLSISQFYSGKSVFVTGGSGFIGKVLIEKLLYTFPDIGRIYLLIRPTRDGKSSKQRLEEEIIQSRVFQLRNDVKYQFDKLIAISGDMTKPGLGLSAEDYKTLTENVSLVFHSAATVRFQGQLKKFIVQNVLGTESIMKLARDMKKLQTVVYVSTAYANCNLIDVEEKVYPLNEDAQTLVDKILQDDSDETPMDGDPSLMGRPNSYTCSKAIAECLVEQKYSDLPVVICRPSIVTHACVEPASGWCDSFNGLAGTLLLGGLGIARTMEINCDYKADIIPVDFVANSLIVIGYHQSLANPDQREKVINITSGMKNPITWGQILDYSRMSALKNPSTKMVRPIAKNPVSSRGAIGKIRHLYTIFFSHIVFAYLFDLVMFVCGQKRMMIDVTNKMHRAFEVLEHFTNRQWSFRNDNYQKIFESLPLSEQEKFPSDVKRIDWISYCDAMFLGCRRYLLNEDDSTIENGKRKQKLLILIYGIINFCLYLFLITSIGYYCFRLNSVFW